MCWRVEFGVVLVGWLHTHSEPRWTPQMRHQARPAELGKGRLQIDDLALLLANPEMIILR